MRATKPEGVVQAEIRLALTKDAPHCRLFRNNVGVAVHAGGSRVNYGIANPGGSDLIGLTSVVITADMIGQKIAVFTALEVKTDVGRPTVDQVRFLDFVNRFGGIAGVVRSPDDAVRLVTR